MPGGVHWGFRPTTAPAEVRRRSVAEGAAGVALDARLVRLHQAAIAASRSPTPEARMRGARGSEARATADRYARSPRSRMTAVYPAQATRDSRSCVTRS